MSEPQASNSVAFEESTKNDTHQSSEQAHVDLNSSLPICMVCQENEATYQPISCDCAYTYCKKCAMKCATGGKCKKCNALYGSLRLSHDTDK
mmetsp:Transcript_26923/g.50296  ORF Transcript_26923/g.50296 Transcript_26923/m.50296 type:complete len:92 (+) Transcript_26923:52-327(+)